jgi:SMI1-KNR4 cell-wall
MVLQVSDNIISALTVSGPSTEEEINTGERELGVQFPPEYREFLAKYGAARIAGYQIAGLTHQDPDQPPLWDSVIQATRSLRDRHGKVGDYDDLIAISGDGMDITFYLRTKGDASGRVLALGPGVEKEVAGTLSEFISRIHSGELNV